MEKMKTRLLRGLSTALTSVTNSPKISQKLGKAKAGLKRGHKPELCPEGTNGTYFMKNEHGANIGVFKPTDEELDSEHNPKQKSLHPIIVSSPSDSCEEVNPWQDTGQSAKQIDPNASRKLLASFMNNKPAPVSVMNGVKQGEAAVREVAAYLIDRQHHFYGVPSTTMIRLSCSRGSHDDLPETAGADTNTEDDEVWMKDNRNVRFKMGSFQEFVESDGSAEDIGFGVFPVREVHKIGILDLHIFNTDRHDGNILYKRQPNGTYTLTPIDHGLSLPHTMEHAWFCWITWPQSQVPLDEASKRYVDSIDAEKDAQILKSQLNISDDSLRVMKTSVMLLKKCVAAGMTLRDIGLIASQSRCDGTPSDLERMVIQANSECNPSAPKGVVGDDDDCYFDKLSAIMDDYIVNKTTSKPGTR